MIKFILFLVVIGIFIAGAVLLFKNGGNESQTVITTPGENVAVAIDFSKNVPNVKSMVGFLHAMSGSKPADSIIAPLKPAAWRGGALTNEIYSRAVGFGARYTIVISDLWRYPQDGVKQPWEYNDNYKKWEDFVRDIAVKTKGKPMVYEIWNEPNSRDLWTGTPEQFYETFKRAHDVLRKELGNSVYIAGPSLAFYSEIALDPFLNAMLSRGIQLDVLTWHEFRPDSEMPKIKSDLDSARQKYVKNPKYAALKIKEIHIDETVPEKSQFRPGSILGYFYYLEKGGADLAGRACWNESNGKNNCWNNSLEGLLTQPNILTSLKPRAAWWTFKAYSDSVSGRVVSYSDSEALVSFANILPDGSAKILISYYGLHATATTMNVMLALDGMSSVPLLKSRSIAKVIIHKIPNTGEAALDAPILIKQTVAGIENNKIFLSLPPLKVYEAYMVKLF